MRVPVPFHILADAIPEDNLRERFTIFLSINEPKSGLRVGTNFSTSIQIIDDDSKQCLPHDVLYLRT